MKSHKEEDRFNALLIAYLQKVQNHYSVNRPTSDVIAKLIKQVQVESARTQAKK